MFKQILKSIFGSKAQYVNVTEVDNPDPIVRTSIEEQRMGYMQLGKLCLKEVDYLKYETIIHDLKSYEGHDDFGSTLGYVIDKTLQHKLYFIFGLDWKSEVANLKHFVEYSLNSNHQIEINLPDQARYGTNASISTNGVFQDFDEVLSQIQFQLGFIDTNSDEYVVIAHKRSDTAAIRNAVKLIGYDYLESHAPKISG